MYHTKVTSEDPGLFVQDQGLVTQKLSAILLFTIEQWKSYAILSKQVWISGCDKLSPVIEYRWRIFGNIESAQK